LFRPPEGSFNILIHFFGNPQNMLKRNRKQNGTEFCYQQFPASGILKEHLDVNLPGFETGCPEMPQVQRSGIAGANLDGADDSPTASRSPGQPGSVFAYVLTSLKITNGKILQTGCAPNIYGDRITLCTCMRRHRTWWNTWKGVWVAGFTRKRYDNQLFYLMQVGQEASSQFELLHSGILPNRGAKSASVNALGDVYEPLSRASHATRFDPNFYELPVANHDHMPNSWKKDICYGYPTVSKIQPKLLVGIPVRSFLWSIPKYSYKGVLHPRFKCYSSLGDFYRNLK
jgi:hypothetical protein